METSAYVCDNCNTIFESPVPSESEKEKPVKCPECGSMQTEELPSWVPLGFNLYTSATEWEYSCKQCNAVFKIPVPSGPDEAKEVKCPECGSIQTERLTALAYELPPYCG